MKDKILKKQYRKYIIPSITAQVVFTAYTMVDGIFVARGVSETALASVNIAMPFVNLLWALSLTFAAGTSAVASRMMGEGKLDEARKVFTRNMIAMVIFGIVISLGAMLGMNGLCTFLGATEETREYVATYLGAIAPFAVAFLASYTLELLTATDGHPTLATIIVSVGVVANVVLDYLFIFEWDKGVWGAAIATSLSQVIVIMIYLCHFLGPKAKIKFCRFRGMKGVLRSLFKGLPSGINEFSNGVITFIYIHEIQRYLSEDKLVTYSAIAYVVIIIVIMGIGVAQGAQPLISYYNGTKENDKVKQLVKYEMISTTWLQIVVVALVFIFAETIIRIFISSDQALIDYSVYALKICCVGGLLVGYNMIFTSFFTAMEKPVQGMIISVSRSTIFVLGGIFIGVALLGADGLWWGMAIEEMLTVITAIVLYKMYNSKRAGHSRLDI